MGERAQYFIMVRNLGEELYDVDLCIPQDFVNFYISKDGTADPWRGTGMLQPKDSMCFQVMFNSKKIAEILEEFIVIFVTKKDGSFVKQQRVKLRGGCGTVSISMKPKTVRFAHGNGDICRSAIEIMSTGEIQAFVIPYLPGEEGKDDLAEFHAGGVVLEPGASHSMQVTLLLNS